MADLNGKTLFITGASRGIGKAIALRAARACATPACAASSVARRSSSLTRSACDLSTVSASSGRPLMR